jgi:predicted secreted hydrolase
LSPCHLARLISIVAAALLLAACAASAPPAAPQTRLTVAEALAGSNQQGFAKATEPRPFVFPQDHGPHQEYATEWWYYTGNLDAADGRHFGYQLTFFRFALAPDKPQRPSDWATSNIYMAHFALTDVAGKQFHAFERFSRDGAGLAGATGDPFRVWLESWSAAGQGADGLPMRLHAAQADVAIDLTLERGKPVVLQGDHGLSQKSAEPGNASYYYSLTRMPTSGAIQIGGMRFEVSGLSWMDREWSTSALAPDQVGWDWFALQLSDGRDLMSFQLRLRDGRSDPYSAGTLVSADGTARTLHAGEITLTPEGTWQSSRDGASYPATWRLQVPSANIDLRLTPYHADQELPLSVAYWEGAVQIEGTAGGQLVGGSGYIEMTGYADQPSAVRVR